MLEIVAAIHLHRAHGEWLLIVNGVLSVLFGLFLVVLPALGILTLVWIVGGYAIVFGVIMLVLAFRLRVRHAPNTAGASAVAGRFSRQPPRNSLNCDHFRGDVPRNSSSDAPG